MKRRTCAALIPVPIALVLVGCDGLQDFARSVDDVAATIIPYERPNAAEAPPDSEAERNYRLGVDYMDGKGVPQSYAKAAELLEKAADAGLPDAQFLLGMLYQTGRGVAQNEDLAATCFRRAAEQQHVEAQFLLGLAYYRGRGVQQNDRTAAEWFAKAAAAGHAGAQYQLGLAYATGRGVARNDTTALEWFEKAAALGHAEAQHFAGQSYTNGWGTTVDHAWAARWYGKAAEQGLAQAQYSLGLSYAAGFGLPRDNVEAYKWLSLAAAQRENEAIKLRDALAKKLAASEIADAQARARRWKASSPGAFADRPTIRFVQVALHALGFQPGPIDGQFGRQTRQALAAYRARAGLSGNGALTPELLRQLKSDRLRGVS